ncbi:MAG: hypothetical protein CM15mP106_0020 [Candidatus Neomarinimicrobiota bacterium]|nr:MAG: hypothetical protein CM15mP106_0020 [Candidatus Neomarinimicrobiota bacterium]
MTSYIDDVEANKILKMGGAQLGKGKPFRSRRIYYYFFFKALV